MRFAAAFQDDDFNSTIAQMAPVIQRHRMKGQTTMLNQATPVKGLMLSAVFALFAVGVVQSQTLAGCTTAGDAGPRIVQCSQLINSGKGSVKDRSAAYIGRASAYATENIYPQAVADYSLALTLDPANADAYVGRAIAYDHMSQYGLAITDATQALHLDPDDIIAYVSRGYAYNEIGQYGLAVIDYTHLIENNGQNTSALIGRGSAHFGKGEYSSALSDYDSAVNADASNPSYYADRGRVLFAGSNFKDATRDFSIAVGLDPSNAYYLLWLHLSLQRSGTSQLTPLASRLRLDLSKWPGPVIKYYLGKTPRSNLIISVTNLGERCEAYFYIAEMDVLKQQLTEARSGLAQAVAICPKTFGEYFVAQAELARIQLSSPTSLR